MDQAPGDAQVHRLRLEIRGLVQGIGFRPFVYRLARRHGLTGCVGNEAAGVFVEVQGLESSLDSFLQNLKAEVPAPGFVREIVRETQPPREEAGFVILPGQDDGRSSTVVPADLAPCAACLAELADPTDRRFGYPFLNCTHCGPRFTIIQRLPYDRPRTTMSPFAMCLECAREYGSPLDRRFHAQPIACPECGPRVWWQPSDSGSNDMPGPGPEQLFGEAALSMAKSMLQNGAIVAIKGVGGFHLVCDATRDATVRELRARKGRGDKPFAVMVAGLEEARRVAHLAGEEEAQLIGPQRPILLLRRRAPVEPEFEISAEVAPGLVELGLMLPYSPLHVLLMTGRPLVFTSGNRSEEPLCRTNEEAWARLQPMADGFLFHDRDIHVSCDDSVCRVVRGRELPMRRARGYAPMPLPWPGARDSPRILAVGAELKSTFCLASTPHAYLSPHIGDLENLETLEAFDRLMKHMMELFRFRPDAIACDLHPDFLSSQWAEEFGRDHQLPVIRIPHHQAHLAALICEHERPPDDPILGVVFDGFGLGPDSSIWGGELFLVQNGRYERAGHLRPVTQPGGDSASRTPYRMAMAWLHAIGQPWDEDLPCVQACPVNEKMAIASILNSRNPGRKSTSVGRLFDAVASLLGVCHVSTYEGQAAMRLEAEAAKTRDSCGENWEFSEPLNPDPELLLKRLIHGLRGGEPVPRLALGFHEWLSQAITTATMELSHRKNVQTVGLTGGVFQNRVLVERTVSRLEQAGFRVLTHQRVPPNDGGLALGQAFLALDRLRHDSGRESIV